MEKKAMEKYYIIISLILGLLVLAISFNYIFSYLSSEEIDWQECRQSIYIRHLSPEFKSGGVSLADLKDLYPLKCRTEVITIDTAEPDKVYGKISDTIAAGWYLFGEGEFDIVPATFLEKDVYCMVFARIHYTDKAKEELRKEEPSDFNLQQKNTRFYNFYRTAKSKDGRTYNDYLPLIIFAEEGAKESVINYNANLYPSDDDLLLVYTAYKNKDFFRQGIYNLGFTLSGKIFDRDENELPFVQYSGMDKTIGLVHPKDLSKIGCSEFLTIPA